MLEKILELLNKIAGSLSENFNQSNLLISLVVYISFIIIYAGFFWNFHKIVSKKEISIEFFEKYKNSKEDNFGKVILGILNFFKYFIIFPIMILFWFIIFALFLLFLLKTNNIESILIISAAMIISIRILAFSQEDLSRNISKIIPLTFLAFFIINPGFSELQGFLDKFNLIEKLINNSLELIIFIFIAEVILRAVNLASIAAGYLKKGSEEKIVKNSRKIKLIKN